MEHINFRDKHQAVIESDLDRKTKVLCHDFINRENEKANKQELNVLWSKIKKYGLIAWFSFIFLLIVAGGILNQTNANNSICNSDKCEARLNNLKQCEKKYDIQKDIVLCATQKVVRTRKNEMTVNDFRNAREEIENLYKLSKDNGVSIEDQAFNFIKDFEGYHEKAYWDYARYSIGYGTPANGRKTITKEQAKQEVIHRIQDILKKMEGVELTNNQKVALVSYFYNVGYKKTVIEYVKKGDHKSVTYIMNKSVYAKGKKLGGLVKRRGAEVSLYLK